MNRLTVGLLLAVVVAACGPPPGALYRLTLTTAEGAYPLPLVLGDQTGLVTGIEPAEFDARDFPHLLIEADRKDPNAFIITWGTGACDDDATVAFYPSRSGYGLDLAVNGGITVGCTAQVIYRAVRITTSAPIDVHSILFIRRE